MHSPLARASRTALLALVIAVIAGSAGPAAAAAPPASPAPAAAAPPGHETDHVDAAPLNLEPFRHLTPDPRPDALVRNAHYLVSNEFHSWVFAKDAEPVGGVMVGVGTDQLFLYAGWYRPQVLIPMDFDGMVADLHRVYALLFARAPTAQDLIAWFAPKARPKVATLIDQEVAEPALAKRMKRAYRTGQRLIYQRLRRIRKRFRRVGVACFLTDAEQYAFVRGLETAGRVFPVRGDLTGPKTMADIARATRDAGLHVRLLYLSNAEQYFPWTPRYRENIRALPFDRRSVVLRTLPDGHNNYFYFVQKGLDLQAWVAAKHVRKVFPLLHTKKRQAEERLYHLDGPPPPPQPKKPKRRRRHRGR